VSDQSFGSIDNVPITMTSLAVGGGCCAITGRVAVVSTCVGGGVLGVVGADSAPRSGLVKKSRTYPLWGGGDLLTASSWPPCPPSIYPYLPERVEAVPTSRVRRYSSLT
jgi:hypothetical protein